MTTRSTSRGITLVEAAIGLSLVLSVAAIALPAFARNLVSSKLVEPVDGLGRIGAAACALVAGGKPLPPSAPLTPADVPRGQRVVDPPGTWESPTWRELGFHPTENGAPHAFSFAFDDTTTAQVPRISGPAALPGAVAAPPAPILHPSFKAASHGDLDGDGVTSTFEIRSQPTAGEIRSQPAAGEIRSQPTPAAGGATSSGPLQVDPEMYVEAEVE